MRIIGLLSAAARRAVAPGLLTAACFLSLPPAGPLGGHPAAAEDAAGISVLSFNVGGLGEFVVDWRTRFTRLAEWTRDHKVPDVIAITEMWGWHACFGFGYAKDYEAIDHLLFQLREKTQVTYRVAYLTGKPLGYSAGCQVYWSQALLYNPSRLSNRTPTAFSGTASLAHDSGAAAAYQPHLRRSLPLCDRGGTQLMPLETLIDGPPQTDKCGRSTPSGPAWAILRSGSFVDANGQNKTYDRIMASFARLEDKSTPARTVDIFVVHPHHVDNASGASVNQLIAQVEPPPYAGSTLQYPPIVVGDFNQLAEDAPGDPSQVRASEWLSGFETKFIAGPGDVIGMYTGLPDRFPSQCRARAVTRLTIPERPAPDVACGEDDNWTDVLVGDHCAAFVRLEPGGPDGCGLRDLFVDAPKQVAAGHTYRMTAVPAGGGPIYAWSWQPGGQTAQSISVKAPSTNGTQNWAVQVTNLSGPGTVSRSGSVRVINNSCSRACAIERAACIADGVPAAQCTSAYEACVAACGQ